MVKSMVFVFLKFGRKEHLLNLMKTGHLHMRTLKYYAELEEPTSHGRSDPLEGTDFIYQPEKMTLLVGGIEIKDILDPIRISLDDSLITHCFCLSSVRADSDKRYTKKELLDCLKIDNANSQFGESCLIIKKPSSFLKRFIDACREQQLRSSGGFVEYVDLKQHHGKYGPFRKSVDFSYQKEYRLIVENTSEDKPRDLFIGDLSDISEIVPSTEVNDIISLRFPEDDGSSIDYKLSEEVAP